ncbi:MAG: M20/M25/M40 family metallo-hydrolase [Sphingobacteriaceae bacterium]|nr:M20/M25/M40 family metallo-hydrolase [Sphingobacteriaceae bacterium]
MIKYLLLILVITNSYFGYSQKVNIDLVKKHISFLASDELNGRGTGTPDEKKAANYIASYFKEVGIKPLKNSYYKNFTFKTAKSSHDTSTANSPLREGMNVVGYLDNKAPLTVVIGAHYDHLGTGLDHNSLEANPEGKIHNGADDNASGTAGVLELARYFSTNKSTEPFNFLFICFSGEELGLIGSKRYLDNPDLALASFNYMINMDMIGRLNEENKLIVYGVGTSPVWVNLLDSIQSGLHIKKDSAGMGPSDHASFYLKEIPALAFFTGQHSDYHKPGDDISKINFKGEEEVLNVVIQVIEKTYNYPKMQFLKTRNPDMGKKSFKVTMGVMPDYTFEGEGMRLDGVSDGKPAQKAGIQKGDIIIQIGEYPIKDVMAYMKVLGNFNKEDLVDVILIRDNKKQTVKVKL